SLLSYISLVFVDVIVPILILLGVGVLLQKKFQFRLRPIANLVTYCFMPAAVFINIYHAEIDISLLAQLFIYLELFITIIIIAGNILSKRLTLEKPEQTFFRKSISLMTSGNYGLPFSQLAFSAHPFGLSVQIIVLVVQNLLTTLTVSTT